jgi:hypothetical protein
MLHTRVGDATISMRVWIWRMAHMPSSEVAGVLKLTRSANRLWLLRPGLPRRVHPRCAHAGNCQRCWRLYANQRIASVGSLPRLARKYMEFADGVEHLNSCPPSKPRPRDAAIPILGGLHHQYVRVKILDRHDRPGGSGYAANYGSSNGKWN